MQPLSLSILRNNLSHLEEFYNNNSLRHREDSLNLLEDSHRHKDFSKQEWAIFLMQIHQEFIDKHNYQRAD